MLGDQRAARGREGEERRGRENRMHISRTVSICEHVEEIEDVEVFAFISMHMQDPFGAAWWGKDTCRMFCCFKLYRVIISREFAHCRCDGETSLYQMKHVQKCACICVCVCERGGSRCELTAVSSYHSAVGVTGTCLKTAPSIYGGDTGGIVVSVSFWHMVLSSAMTLVTDCQVSREGVVY